MPANKRTFSEYNAGTNAAAVSQDEAAILIEAAATSASIPASSSSSSSPSFSSMLNINHFGASCEDSESLAKRSRKMTGDDSSSAGINDDCEMQTQQQENNKAAAATSESLNSYFVKAKSIKIANQLPRRATPNCVLYQDKRMLFFGGEEKRQIMNQFLEYNFETNEHHELTLDMANASEPQPLGRRFHSCVVVDDKMVIFGGKSPNGNYLGDMYEYSFISNKWSRITQLNQGPGKIACHSTVVYKQFDTFTNSWKSYLLVFGGLDERKDLVCSLFQFCFERQDWVVLQPIESMYARYEHSAVMQNKKNRMIVFGGTYDDRIFYNDVWIYDIVANAWSKLNTKGRKPPNIAMHCSAMLPCEDKMVVFGGFNHYSSADNQFNDLYILDLNDSKWTKLEIHGESIPGPISNASLMCTSNLKAPKLYLYGGLYTIAPVGSSGSKASNDLFVLELESDAHLEQRPNVLIPNFEKNIWQKTMAIATLSDQQQSMSNELELFADTELKVMNKVFKVHRTIIARAPKLLEKKEWNNESSHLFEQMLRFLYGFDPILSADNLVDFYCLVKKFEIPHLDSWVFNKLGQELNSDIIAQILRQVDANHADLLKKRCLLYLKSMSADKQKEILNSMHDLSKDFIIEITKAFLGEVPVIQEQIFESPISLLMHYLRDSLDTSADFELVTSDGKVFKAHKFVLAAQSSFFENYFSPKYSDCLKPSIDLGEMNISSAAMDSALKFCYCSEITLPFSNHLIDSLLDLIQAANVLMIKSLEDECIKCLCMYINSANALHILAFANRLQCKSLRDKVFEKITDCFSKHEILKLTEAACMFLK